MFFRDIAARFCAGSLMLPRCISLNEITRRLPQCGAIAATGQGALPPSLPPIPPCSTWSPYSVSSSAFSTSAGALMGGQQKAGGQVSGGSGGQGPNKIERSPVSKAVALLVSRDRLQRDRLILVMSDLCKELLENIDSLTMTEVATFCEVAKKLDFCTQALTNAVTDYLQLGGRVQDMCAEELPGVLWVVSEKGDLEPTLAEGLGELVYKHLDELRHEDLPDLIPIMQGLGELVHKHLDELRHEDLPDLIPIMAWMCPAEPFLLTALSDLVLKQLGGFTPVELQALVAGYGSREVRRTFFDDRVFKELADTITKRLPEFSPIALRAILTVYREMGARHANLVPTLVRLEAELAPFTNPTPQ